MRRLPQLTLLLLFIALALAVGPAALGQPTRPTLGRAWLQAERNRLQAALPSGRVDAAPAPARVRLLVELEDQPVAVTYAAALAQPQTTQARASSAARSQLARLEQAQQAMLTELGHLGATPIYRLQRVYNGIALEIDAAQIGALRAMPGVARISPLRPKLRGNASSVPLIGAPTVWSGGLGVSGQGMRIGIIDTGIDYTHAGLGGSGLTGEYAANNSLVLTDTASINNFGSGKKVSGGYDFSGDTYNATCTAADITAGLCSKTPQPDPDPFDSCDGHGTHVAGTAAGNGVLNNGAAFSGPYNNGLDFSQFRVGPGVAPQATLYALRVFGCGGSSDIVDQAIEWAVDPNGDGDLSDHLDVINMSLGGAFGSALDSSAIASNNAALAGVIVVAAAGNSGDTYYISDSPGIAERAISVAASVAGLTTARQNMLPSFSARGPRRGDSFLKPDLSAPGDQIVSTGMGTGSGARTLSGTSMATPHVAGMMALLRQRYPSWTVEELKALAMNSATQDLFRTENSSGTPYGPGRVGAGRVILPAAAEASLIAYNAVDPGLVSVSFGVVSALSQTITLSKPVRVVNKGLSDQELTASYLPRVQTSGVTVTIAPTLLSIAAGASAIVTVTLSADPQAMQRDGRDPSVQSKTSGLDRHWLDELAGYLQLSPAGGAPLRVPIHAAPRRNSAMSATPQQFDFAGAATVSTAIVLNGLDIASPSQQSLVSAFELHEISSRSTTGYTSSADLAYLGVMSDIGASVTAQQPTGSLSETIVAFGIATHGPWSTPHACDTQFTVQIDTDGSGIAENGEGAEFSLVNTSAKDVARVTCNADDVFVTALYRANGTLVGFEYTNLVPATIDTAIYNSDVLVLPVAATKLGLSTNNSSISYRVVTEILGQAVIDRSETHSFDVANPGLDFNTSVVGSLQADLAGSSIALRFNRQPYINDHAIGLLLLHHHNQNGSRAEVINIAYTNRPLYLPLVVTLPPAQAAR